MNVKRLFGALSVNICILLVIGGGIMFSAGGDFIVSFKPAVSFEEMFNGAEVKAGSHVAGEVVYSLGYYAAESTYTQRSDGSRSGDKANGRYYLIPIAEGENYIGLKAREVDVSAMEKVTKETEEWILGGAEPSTKIVMQGTVEVMEGQLADFYKESLMGLGYSRSDIDDMGEPLVVQYRSFTAVRVMFGVGLGLVLLGVFFIYRVYKRG